MVWSRALQIMCGITMASTIEAHGYLSQPAAQYNDPLTATNFITAVDGQQLFSTKKWDDTPQSNSARYSELLKEGAIGELKEFINKYVDGCPKNSLNQVIDVNGLTTMKWQNDQYREGFIASHTGPCEAWIDDEKVFSDNDCAAHYSKYPAELMIDYTKCKKSSCMFSFYWMALHEPKWQLYKACVMISGSKTGNSNGGTNTISGSYKRGNGTQQFNCTLNQ